MSLGYTTKFYNGVEPYTCLPAEGRIMLNTVFCLEAVRLSIEFNFSQPLLVIILKHWHLTDPLKCKVLAEILKSEEECNA